MNRVMLFVLMCGMTGMVCAQQANFRQAEKFRKAGSETGSLKVSPHFLKGSDKFWYSYKTSEGTSWYLVDPGRRTKRMLFDNDYMAQELTRITFKPYSAKSLPIRDIEFQKDQKTVKFKVNEFNYEYNTETRVLVQRDSVKFPKNDNKWATFSPDSTYMIFARKHNLYLMKTGDKDSVEIQLTTDGEPFYSYARNERDTSSGRTWAKVSWFKDSKKFYTVRGDARKLKDLWVIDVLSARPKLEEYRYSMPGDKEVRQYELNVFDVAEGKQVKINTEKWPDQSLSVLHAGKDSDRIYFQRKRRTCDELDICVANTVTGESKVLINEQSKPYFNDQMYHLSILEDGKDLIWWSERTGWGHFYHYDKDGNLKNVISSGQWVAGKMVRIDTVGRTIYFEGYGREKGRNPYYACVYKAHIDREGVQLLTPEDANHSVAMPVSGRFLVDNYSRVDLEPCSVLRDNNGKVLMELARPDLKRLYEMGWKMPERFTVKARDGVTDLYGVMWKPADFDSTKTYPVISYVYPGPQTEAVPADFTVNGAYNMALAQVGFIVVNFGHRGGSPQRDKWYHTYGYANLRDYALADDKYGIEQLADRFPFIDVTKVGIFGHSGGGFMSTAALCTY
ncbi:MAG: S9 family peptidase, partial [Odoribacter sp.]|nr:S9 family peptidase [Odoribacter sp.]